MLYSVRWRPCSRQPHPWRMATATVPNRRSWKASQTSEVNPTSQSRSQSPSWGLALVDSSKLLVSLLDTQARLLNQVVFFKKIISFKYPILKVKLSLGIPGPWPTRQEFKWLWRLNILFIDLEAHIPCYESNIWTKGRKSRSGKWQQEQKLLETVHVSVQEYYHMEVYVPFPRMKIRPNIPE